MKSILERRRIVDFESLGYDTMLQCRDQERATHICGLEIQSYALGLRPELMGVESRMEELRGRHTALHDHLYDRPVPVNDAAMLTHADRVRIVLALTVLAAIACFVGNLITFHLFGFGLALTVLIAAGTTALPLVVGHLAYERIVARHKGVQAAIVLAAVLLCFMAVYQLAEARRLMLQRTATEKATATSYVDDATQPEAAPDALPEGTSERDIRDTLGRGMLFFVIAAELMMGFLVGVLARMRTDEDYEAWRELKRIAESLLELKQRAAELVAQIEIAKKRCAAGILRAQVVMNKRRVPYHRALTALTLVVLASGGVSRAQTVERYEGILIDTSGSIARSATSDLFQQYLLSTKKLLATEPPNTRVWVSSIEVDSFGSNGAILKGWTPDSRGVFTGDLNRARRQLASAFEGKSSGLSPSAAGTDIFGALWRLKTLFESGGASGTDQGFPKIIWIFSDMMNETRVFQMPALLDTGPERMLERAKANRLVVPLKGYRIYVYGATPAGLTPQAWTTVKHFWSLYFEAAGAELVTYSAECDVQR